MDGLIARLTRDLALFPRRVSRLARHFALGLRNPRLQWHTFHHHDHKGFCQ
jgi:hypothetical protein